MTIRDRIAQRLARLCARLMARDMTALRVQLTALRAQLSAALAERDAANARVEELTGGAPCSSCPIKAELELVTKQRDTAVRAGATLADEREQLREQLDAAMEALDALYCAALGLHGLVATTPGHAIAYAALKAALKSARGPLGPWTKARGRRPVRVSEVQADDRVCWAAAAGFTPFAVEAVSDRDCHGMITLTGEDRLLHLHADSMVTVERGPRTQPPRE